MVLYFIGANQERKMALSIFSQTDVRAAKVFNISAH